MFDDDYKRFVLMDIWFYLLLNQDKNKEHVQDSIYFSCNIIIAKAVSVLVIEANFLQEFEASSLVNGHSSLSESDGWRFSVLAIFVRA
jgi:hypothetical protein